LKPVNLKPVDTADGFSWIGAVEDRFWTALTTALPGSIDNACFL